MVHEAGISGYVTRCKARATSQGAGYIIHEGPGKTGSVIHASKLSSITCPACIEALPETIKKRLLKTDRPNREQEPSVSAKGAGMKKPKCPWKPPVAIDGYFISDSKGDIIAGPFSPVISRAKKMRDSVIYALNHTYPAKTRRKK